MKNVIKKCIVCAIILMLVGCGSSIPTSEKKMQAFRVQVPDGWNEEIAREDMVDDNLNNYGLYIYSSPNLYEGKSDGGLIVFVGQYTYEHSLYYNFFMSDYDRKEYGGNLEYQENKISIKGMDQARKIVQNGLMKDKSFVYDIYQYVIYAPNRNKYNDFLLNNCIYIIGYVASNSNNASSYKSLFEKIANNMKVDEDEYGNY